MRKGDRPNRELVVYVLGLLGGGYRSVHTEDIAVKAHKLYPDTFSWTNYPNLPDKDVVRVALTDSRKEKYGALVYGRSGQSSTRPSSSKPKRAPDGWGLTEAGIHWFNRESTFLATHSDKRMLRDHRQAVLRRMRRVLEHSVFDMYMTEPVQFAPSLGDIASLLRCRVDAPEEVWNSRFLNLERDATASDRNELTDFIKKCREAYKSGR